MGRFELSLRRLLVWKNGCMKLNLLLFFCGLWRVLPFTLHRRVPRFFITGGGLPCSRVSPFEPACFGTALPRAEGGALGATCSHGATGHWLIIQRS